MAPLINADFTTTKEPRSTDQAIPEAEENYLTGNALAYTFAGTCSLFILIIFILSIAMLCACVMNRIDASRNKDKESIELQPLESISAPTTAAAATETTAAKQETTTESDTEGEGTPPTTPSSSSSRLPSPDIRPPSPARGPLTSRADDPPAYTLNSFEFTHTGLWDLSYDCTVTPSPSCDQGP